MATRRSYTLSNRHDTILTTLATKLDCSMVNVVERALEALEEKEALRTRTIKEAK